LAVTQEFQTNVYIKLNSINLQHLPKDRNVKERHNTKRRLNLTVHNRGELIRYDFISFNFTKFKIKMKSLSMT